MYPWIEKLVGTGKIEPRFSEWTKARNHAVGLLEEKVRDMYGFSEGAWDDVRKSGRVRVEVETTKGTRQSEERYYLDDMLVGYVHAVVYGDVIRFEAFAAPPEDQIAYDPTGVKYAPTREETFEKFIRGEDEDGPIKNTKPVKHRKKGEIIKPEKLH